ncbi:hypothetical protein EXW28_29955 (plasmid) [Bacillus mycoides]|uniref:hypothetical protein n=2 Tax=Bacillus mycoides TaxID=1405 RepID=UPI000A27CB90|nr:hypothetical protein [Bacillus mycoides]OSY04314.1 hypothetical protein BTJ48_04539 [Bacillus mycoides]QWG53945.1 hypothetical protein EXW37_29935 [Bacillus mycoides]QWH37755.1 hypothetical protein EXW28_29955 [Bacillus mycoides]HDR7648182.1 hypothetical protein [Bacillus mycoides]
MLKIDRTAVDKAIEEMELFTATKEVLANYEAEKKVLEKREEALTERLAQLQEHHAQILIDREVANDSPSDYIYMSKQLTNINEDVKVITSLQEQLKEDFTALKQKYAPTIQEVYSKDLRGKDQLPVNDMVDSVRYELIKSISDYAREVRNQQAPLMDVIDEFLDDAEVMETNRSFKRLFEFDSTNVHYSESQKSVIDRMHIFSACSGNMPSEIRKPKEAELSE